MIVSTTNTLEGHPIKEYRGIVSGETIIGANIMRDFTSAIRDVIGGRATAYERSLQEAKETAIQEMLQEAEAQGANAVIGVDLDFETVGANGSMLMVSASGTAVIIE